MILNTQDLALDNAAPSSILVTVSGAWADIWIDGERVGRTGDGAISVSPGTHQLRLENEFAMPHEEEFTVLPGQTHSINVTEMKRKPAAVILPQALDKDCQVSLDETEAGTLQSINYVITIEDPNETHRLLIRCTDNKQYAKIIEPIKPGTTVPISFNSQP